MLKQQCHRTIDDLLFLQHSQNRLILQVIHRCLFKGRFAIVALFFAFINKHKEYFPGLQIFNYILRIDFAIDAHQLWIKARNQKLRIECFLQMYDSIKPALYSGPISALLNS